MAKTKLPYDNELENSVLGTVIVYENAYDLVSKYIVELDVFGQEKAKMLWNKITDMKREKKKIDLVTICSSLTLDEVKKGLTNYYISGCTGSSSVEGTVDLYASQIYEKYLMRRVIIKVDEIQKQAEGNYNKVYDTISEAHTLFGELLRVKPSKIETIDEIIDNTISDINQDTSKLLSTGYPQLDRFAGGLTRGEITIFGGRPGHGKTTVLINILAKVLNSDNKAIFFSRELPNTELIKKIICLESQELSYSMVRKNVYSEQELKHMDIVIANIKKKYNKDKFLMFDNIRNFQQAASEIKKFKPDVIFDDYIQLIRYKGKEEQRRLQIEQLVNDYKWLAKETESVVVLASQLNRGIEYRDKSYEPQLSDLAESGAIEQVAENVFFTHYDYKIKGEAGKGKNILTLSAKKVRYGDTGTVDLGYDGDKCTVYNSIKEMIDEIPF